jgi:hypothetical protein
MATDFGLSIMLITSVFMLGLCSIRIVLLGMIGTIIGVITLFDLASTGQVIMGYAYNMSGETPVLEQIIETSIPLQMLALIIILFTVLFTVANVVRIMRD